MPLAKSYTPSEIEPRLQAFWQAAGIYHFDPDSEASVYSIDTPPPTVSGHLHLGHVYSYSHADFIARFQRMKGCNVYYPMGYDDNGLPTERLVEKRLGIRAADIGRQAFIEKCLQVSEEAEGDYQALWQRLGLSIDWRYTYRTIDAYARRACQLSFIELAQQGLAYRKEAPAIWCPECRTSIAQAELNDLDRESEFVTLRFPLTPGPSPIRRGESLMVATTRPELLPACVAIFVHPDDTRYQGLVGQQACAPLFGQRVPVLADPAADPEKGTGAVMCCTFGDTTDVAWWHTYKLPLIEAIDRTGRMTAIAREFADLPLAAARQQIKQTLEANGWLIERQPTRQSIRVHERCDTPVEYVVARQWFVKVLDFKSELLEMGAQIGWRPEQMQARYRAWVENLNWDWCLSRQRYYGVPFPVWYCAACGETILADETQLPVEPLDQRPLHACPKCGGDSFRPEEDIFDTWATSSLSPQIVGQRLQNPALYARVFPFSLRPQAHEIIRTWAFYTIAKSYHHWKTLPWKDALISGWGLAGEGMGKISKSRGGGPMSPTEMIARYSADAVRYWAASAGPGKDSIISEEKIQMGAKLITKLWNVARFAERFVEEREEDTPAGSTSISYPLSPADHWILSRLQKLIRRVTALLEAYDYAAAKSEIEAFFWTELTDNYLEMAKQRLYDPACPTHAGACNTIRVLLLTLLKLFAPFLPYVTEAIYQGIGEKGLGAYSANIDKTLWIGLCCDTDDL
jgi:valyl-tRNA synthetase